MKSFTVEEQDAARGAAEWIEFQRSEDLSTGLYVLDVGAVDGQEPHSEDEIYVYMTGRATLRTPSGEVAVRPGSVLFVAAHEEHRFVDVTEELRLVVVFGPAEGTRG